MGLNKLVDSRDARFVLFEMLEADKLSSHPAYSDINREMIESTLDLVEKLSYEQIYPTNSEGDRIGVKYDPASKKVTVPECFREPYKKYVETGLSTMNISKEYGGMEIPDVVHRACSEYLTAANTSFLFYPGLTHGAANLIITYGNDYLKKTFLGKMISGEWGGTMCLTEPEAGSDVGNLKTKAVKQSDGTYLITGQKIFITAAENDLVSNIIHPVLARIDGDPQGTKGISIFIVPKFLVKTDGSLGARNDVVCTGVEHKMGLHGSPTCSLSFGDNGKCVGYLLGQERQGMKIMFQMMNEARIGVGVQGLALSSSAYLHALSYAKVRVQGSDVLKMMEPNPPKVAIIQHPDVKRMLLWMKSYIEAMRMFTYYLSYNIDLSKLNKGESASEANAIVEILTPICKAGNTDMCWLIIAEAIQIFGGYGYTADYRVEQLARDSKIASLYEGTNGIQAMDLIMRKILMNKEQYNYNVWKKRVGETLDKAKGIVDDKYISSVQKGISRFDGMINIMKDQIAAGNITSILGNAAPVLKAMFELNMAWMQIWSLSLTIPELNNIIAKKSNKDLKKIVPENNEAAYYSGKIIASKFWLNTEFPKFSGRIEAILTDDTSISDAVNEMFTGSVDE